MSARHATSPPCYIMAHASRPAPHGGTPGQARVSPATQHAAPARAQSRAIVSAACQWRRRQHRFGWAWMGSGARAADAYQIARRVTMATHMLASALAATAHVQLAQGRRRPIARRAVG